MCLRHVFFTEGRTYGKAQLILLGTLFEEAAALNREA